MYKLIYFQLISILRTYFYLVHTQSTHLFTESSLHSTLNMIQFLYFLLQHLVFRNANRNDLNLYSFMYEFISIATQSYWIHSDIFNELFDIEKLWTSMNNWSDGIDVYICYGCGPIYWRLDHVGLIRPSFFPQSTKRLEWNLMFAPKK